MVICKLLGRFGNILWKIFNTFKYCNEKNISYSNIVLQADKRSIVRSIFFREYQKYIKNIDFDYKNNIYFKKYEFWNQKYLITSIKDIELFGLYFYNKIIFDDVINKLNYDFKKYIAVHIRRTDFLKHLNGIFNQNKDKINLRLNKYPNELKLIFTDDKKWFIDNFQRQDCIIFNDNNLKDYEIFIAMSKCKNVDYHIGSTFSQCSKYMNNYINKKYITDDLNDIKFI